MTGCYDHEFFFAKIWLCPMSFLVAWKFVLIKKSEWRPHSEWIKKRRRRTLTAQTSGICRRRIFPPAHLPVILSEQRERRISNKLKTNKNQKYEKQKNKSFNKMCLNNFIFAVYLIIFFSLFILKRKIFLKPDRFRKMHRKFRKIPKWVLKIAGISYLLLCFILTLVSATIVKNYY